MVEGQRLTQAASDIMLGWLTARRARRREARLLRAPALGPEGLGRGRDDDAAGDERSTRELCGGTLARAHARSGDRIAIGSYLGGGDSFDRAMPTSPTAYADQNERDYAALQAAVEDGRLAVEQELIDGRPTLFGPLTVEKEGVQAI